MKVSHRIASAGQRGFTRMPVLGCEIQDLCNERGEFDEGKARHVLRDFEDHGVAISSRDDSRSISFGVELMHQIEHACEYLIKNRETSGVSDREEKKDDQHARRNMERNRFVFANYSVNYSRAEHKMKVKIWVDNPKGVVGIAERIAYDYALIVARCAIYMADNIGEAKKHGLKIELIGGAGCENIFDEARKIEANLAHETEVKEMNLMMWKCERRTGSGFCSPCKFDCPHYFQGRCVEVK